MSRWSRFALGVAAGVALVVVLWVATGPPAPDAALRVLVAKKILTMEPDRPVATAVAIASGRILALGSLDEVRAALGDRSFDVDTRFRDHILMPGFVDPHIHPTLAATILPMEIVSAMEWATPRGRKP